MLHWFLLKVLLCLTDIDLSRHAWIWLNLQNTPAFLSYWIEQWVRFLLEVELFCFWERAGRQYFHVRIVLVVDLSQSTELIVEFKVGGGYYFEEGISVIFEVDFVLVCFIDGHSISKAFSGEIALVLLSSGESTDEDSLSIRKIISLLFFRHVDMFTTI